MGLIGLGLVLLCAVLPAAGQQQTISVYAEVTQGTIDVQTLQEMRFGTVEPGTEVLTVDPVADDRAGLMLASGAPESDIRISFVPEQPVRHVEGRGPDLEFHFQVAGNPVDDQESAEIIEPDADLHQIGEEGEFYLWIGGQIDITEAVSGAYETEFTLEIEYN